MLGKEGVTKRQKRVWGKQKSERIVRRFSNFTSFASQLVCFGARLYGYSKEAATYVTTSYIILFLIADHLQF